MSKNQNQNKYDKNCRKCQGNSAKYGKWSTIQSSSEKSKKAGFWLFQIRISTKMRKKVANVKSIFFKN